MSEETRVSKEEIQGFKKDFDRKFIKKRHTWDVEKSLFVILRKANNEYFSTDRADDCVWLTDLRGKKRIIHMTKEQAREVGKDLVEISKSLVILEKSKRIWVPPSGRKKGYWREDPRGHGGGRTITIDEAKAQGLIETLKNLLQKIVGLKKQGKFTKEQRKYVYKKLQEIEPRLRHFKVQGQRIAVAKVMKEIRAELTEKSIPRIMSKDGKAISDEFKDGLKRLGYTVGDMKRKSLHEIKTVYYNEISKE